MHAYGTKTMRTAKSRAGAAAGWNATGVSLTRVSFAIAIPVLLKPPAHPVQSLLHQLPCGIRIYGRAGRYAVARNLLAAGRADELHQVAAGLRAAIRPSRSSTTGFMYFSATFDTSYSATLSRNLTGFTSARCS